ncbi:MAG: S41 family peptidase [Actinobacteria bacterium]|nr:S41 family peptidase [Actinomycetota bacterium]
MKTLIKLTAAFTVVLILVVAAFGMGVWFERTVLAHPEVPSGGDATNTADLESAVSEVAGIIEREALVPSSETSMTTGAIWGILGSLEDSHAVYFDARHYDYFNQENDGIFYGIGVTISNDGNDLVVTSVFEGTPAEAEGLKADDVIVEIDGEIRERWDVEEAVLLIRGEEGTQVTLGIRRNGEEDLREFTITRAKIDVPNIESEMLEGDIGYIRLYQFTDPAVGEVREALDELAGKGAKGFVLDLRDNPGGLLDSAIDVTSLFVADGVIVRVEDREGTVEEYRATGEIATDAPLVVLINGNSASASEILGGAVQDYGRAVLVGERSFGKGSVQQIEPLSFGGAIKLTIAHYVTPKNRVIDRVGLAPDVVVEMAPELQRDHETDTQLERAIAELEKQL